MNDRGFTEQTRARVDDVRERLRERYGGFEVVEKTWPRSPSVFARIERQYSEDRLDGAGVWLTNEAGEVLLVRNEGDAGWGDPGGKVELGEDYETAAKRELREETGVDCELTGLRELHEIENVSTGGGSASIFEVIVVFDGTYRGGEPRAREGEIADVGWFTEPPETVLYEEVRTRPYPASE